MGTRLSPHGPILYAATHISGYDRQPEQTLRYGHQVETTRESEDNCLISNLPFISGVYYRSPIRDSGVF